MWILIMPESSLLFFLFVCLVFCWWLYFYLFCFAFNQSTVIYDYWDRLHSGKIQGHSSELWTSRVLSDYHVCLSVHLISLGKGQRLLQSSLWVLFWDHCHSTLKCYVAIISIFYSGKRPALRVLKHTHPEWF